MTTAWRFRSKVLSRSRARWGATAATMRTLHRILRAPGRRVYYSPGCLAPSHLWIPGPRPDPSQSTLWFWAGGLFDFRMDFFAYCLYGVWACAVIRSKLFLDRRWAIGCGLIGTFLVLNRFLTLIYLVGVSAGLAGVFVIIWILHRGDTELSRRMRQRLFNLGLSLGILVILVGPILVVNRAAIYNKYVYAQFFYEKDTRARELGIVGLRGHLFYYPISILRDHLGKTFLLASAISLLGTWQRGFLQQGAEIYHPKQAPRDEIFLLQVIFLLGAVLGPILSVDNRHFEIAGHWRSRRRAGGLTRPHWLAWQPILTSPSRPPVGTSSLLLHWLCSPWVYSTSSIVPPKTPQICSTPRSRTLERAQELDKWLVNYASENGWRNPTISLDVISGMLNSGAIVTSGYEQLGQLVEFQTIFASR